MSAFALGLIGDPIASVALVQSLRDPSPLVQGRAAEALGRLGAIDAAPAIGEVVTRHITSAFEVHPEDLSYPQSQEVEAFRLGIYALAELKSFEVLAAAVLRDNGQPILWWWPVAYALQRIEDPRALTSLIALTGVQGTIGVSLAAQGLGTLGNPAAVDALVNLLNRNLRNDRVVATAVRALGRIEGAAATEALRSFVLIRDLKPMLRLEAVQALSGRLGLDATPIFSELITHRWPDMRAAAIRALAQSDSETFMLVLSGLEPDQNWRVRAATAQALGYVFSVSTYSRLMEMFGDQDPRVLPSVLSALVAIEAPDIQSILMMALQRDDVVVRKVASQLLATLKPLGFEEALTNAYRAAAKDDSYLARVSILEALVESDSLTKREVLREGLSDSEWPVRLRAADLLSQLETGDDHATTIRPAPRRGEVSYTAQHLVNPRVSPHVYLETERGTIQIELAVLDAPQTTENFVRLARAGYYDGLTFHRIIHNYVAQGGDPRGDSEGGPGYTLRDELNQLPFLRGTVGMALDWQDTGGSQFFITQSPQPQLDGRYTAFGRVIAGMDVVDQLLKGDVINRAIVWDGTESVTR
jgi:cyclophilin family peptidyl-prolyl cis-trans isomerase/HEAT repeat protein